MHVPWVIYHVNCENKRKFTDFKWYLFLLHRKLSKLSLNINRIQSQQKSTYSNKKYAFVTSLVTSKFQKQLYLKLFIQ